MAENAVEKPQGLYEKHKKVYVRSVTGFFSKWRWFMVFFSQAIFYGLCWVQWNGRQAVLFHLVERKFYLFGLVLWPQDVFYLAVLLIISAFSLFLFTAVAGRLFCGYACPQTVYTEIFLWIEAKIEGDRPARIKFDKRPNDARKIGLKALKHLIWLLVAFWTGFTLVCYFTPAHELWQALTSFRLGGWETFWIFFYGGFLYMQAGFLREQVCKYMCPYARFQGVMFDPDTLIISYDPERGEPRGQRKKGVDPRSIGKGDCIDCDICVQVCPTGIDIRKGLQIECIGCAACIDACDQIMDKMNYPRGLIRYSTEQGLAKHYTQREIVAHILRPRVLLYSSILLAAVLLVGTSLLMRVPLKVDVIRDRSVLMRETDDGKVENIYTLHIMNTDEQDHQYHVAVEGLPGIAVVGDNDVKVTGASSKSMTISVQVDPEAVKKMDAEGGDAGKKKHRGARKVYIALQALDNAKIAVREKTSFILE